MFFLCFISGVILKESSELALSAFPVYASVNDKYYDGKMVIYDPE